MPCRKTGGEAEDEFEGMAQTMCAPLRAVPMPSAAAAAAPDASAVAWVCPAGYVRCGSVELALRYWGLGSGSMGGGTLLTAMAGMPLRPRVPTVYERLQQPQQKGSDDATVHSGGAKARLAQLGADPATNQSAALGWGWAPLLDMRELRFSVRPALPSGLKLDPRSGVISGAPASWYFSSFVDMERELRFRAAEGAAPPQEGQLVLTSQVTAETALKPGALSKTRKHVAL